jgi:truncated hemoglobin YjbI
MQRATKRKVAFTVLLAALVLAGAVGAQDKKPAGKPFERGTLDESIYQSLRGIIDHGADLYNQGDWNGCYRLWEGALMSLKPLLGDRQLRAWAKTAASDNTVYTEALKGVQSQLGDRPALKNVIDTALSTAQQTPQTYRRAFILRVALDQLRAETKPAKATAAKGTKPNGTPASKKTLWDRLGGEAGVTKIVDDFVNLAAPDPKVDFFRGGRFQMTADQVVKMKRELVEQISQASGGTLKYTGPDMKKVHESMGITEAQFNAAVAHLKKALEKNKVAPEDVKKVLDAVGSYRNEIVEPKIKEEKKREEKKSTKI